MKQGLNNNQIKLVQTAVRKAGLRGPGNSDGRYRLLLSQYRQPNGKPVTSCKQLNRSQMEDLLAICEAYGWRMPGKPPNHYRRKVEIFNEGTGSYAQETAIRHLAGDLGWDDQQLKGFVRRMTKGRTDALEQTGSRQAYAIIEALKAMVGRERGTQYGNLKEVRDDMEAKDGQAGKVT